MDINAPFTNADVVASLRRAAGLPEPQVEDPYAFVEEEPVHPPRWHRPGRRNTDDAGR